MELVLYYGTNDPGMKKHEMMMKSVLVRMGVKIRNVKPEQVMETIGCLAGMPGFQEQENASAPLPVIPGTDAGDEGFLPAAGSTPCYTS